MHGVGHEPDDLRDEVLRQARGAGRALGHVQQHGDDVADRRQWPATRQCVAN